MSAVTLCDPVLATHSSSPASRCISVGKGLHDPCLLQHCSCKPLCTTAKCLVQQLWLAVTAEILRPDCASRMGLPSPPGSNPNCDQVDKVWCGGARIGVRGCCLPLLAWLELCCMCGMARRHVWARWAPVYWVAEATH